MTLVFHDEDEQQWQEMEHNDLIRQDQINPPPETNVPTPKQHKPPNIPRAQRHPPMERKIRTRIL